MIRHVTKTSNTNLFFLFFFSSDPSIEFRSLVGASLFARTTRKMKRGSGKFDLFKPQQQISRLRSIQVFICVLFLYVVFVYVHIPTLLFDSGDKDMMKVSNHASHRTVLLEDENVSKYSTNGNRMNEVVFRQSRNTLRVKASAPLNLREIDFFKETHKSMMSGLVFDFGNNSVIHQDRLRKSAKKAWDDGLKLWEDLQSETENVKIEKVRSDSNCPNSVSMTGDEFNRKGRILNLPCGLTLGSHITVVGKPKPAQSEINPKIHSTKFVLELQGLKTSDSEDPPRILHLNPRLSGDWSGKSVIEMNTCYRMQWGTPQRCEGWRSASHEKTVDGQVKCEKWNESDYSDNYKSKWMMDQLIGRKKVNVEWPFPFAENKMFVLTLNAGFEGYHLNVNGRHISSFPYRVNFGLEDATGLWINGDVVVQSVYSASLPTSHPRSNARTDFEIDDKWKAPPILKQSVELFIGILSAGNHFAERMAVRKSWMQHSLIRSSRVAARFFVALHASKEVNVELKKEAEYFGDIVIVPYIDNYDLVVLKTVAICEYGVRTLSARTVMKCDDDTFVRVDVVYYGAKRIGKGSFYAGNINYHHKPLRHGKWAVTNAEWAEKEYPPYANGPGYLISADIAKYVVTEFEKNELRLFKMEDVSVGVWVEKFNSNKTVKYVHSMKFCQHGCIKNYYTAHYQSPRQMQCLWQKLMYYGRPQCCNM